MNSPSIDLSPKPSSDLTLTFLHLSRKSKPSSISSSRTASTFFTATPTNSKIADFKPQKPKTKKNSTSHRRTVSFQKSPTTTLINTNQSKKSVQHASMKDISEPEKKRPPKLVIPDLAFKELTNNNTNTKSPKKESASLKSDTVPGYQKPTLSSLLAKKDLKAASGSPSKNLDMSKPFYMFGEYSSPISGAKASPNAKGSISQRPWEKETSPYSSNKKVKVVSPVSSKKSKSPASNTSAVKSLKQDEPTSIRRCSLINEHIQEESICMSFSFEEEKKAQDNQPNENREVKCEESNSVLKEHKSNIKELNNYDNSSIDQLVNESMALKLEMKDDNDVGTVPEISELNKDRRSSSFFSLKPYFTPSHKKDLFLSSTGNYFAINKDNIWLSEIEGKYSSAFLSARNDMATLKTTLDQAEIDDKSQATNSKPMVVVIDKKNKIIQPVYMKNMGTMCLTELWPEKINKRYLHSVKSEPAKNKAVTSRPKTRQHETLFKPSKWSKEDNLQKKLASMKNQWGHMFDIKAKAEMETAGTNIKKGTDATNLKRATSNPPKETDKAQTMASPKTERLKARTLTIEERMLAIIANRKSVLAAETGKL